MGKLFFETNSTPFAIKKFLQKRTRARRPVDLEEIYDLLPKVPKPSIRRILSIMKSYGQVKHEPVHRTWEWVF